MKPIHCKSNRSKAQKSREGCIVHPGGRISDAEFHEPILSGITSDVEAQLKKMSRERARQASLSEHEIKKLYG
jgi:hypothetical protein